MLFLHEWICCCDVAIQILSLVFRSFGLTIRFDSSFSSMVDCYLRGDGVVGGFVFRAVSFVHGGFAVPPCDEVTRRVWLVDMFFGALCYR